MKKKDNLVVGKRSVPLERPSHVRGVPQGGSTGSLRRDKGIHPVGDMARGTARRSTGINDKKRDSIVPGSPTISPS